MSPGCIQHEPSSPCGRQGSCIALPEGELVYGSAEICVCHPNSSFHQSAEMSLYFLKASGINNYQQLEKLLMLSPCHHNEVLMTGFYVLAFVIMFMVLGVQLRAISKRKHFRRLAGFFIFVTSALLMCIVRLSLPKDALLGFSVGYTFLAAQFMGFSTITIIVFQTKYLHYLSKKVPFTSSERLKSYNYSSVWIQLSLERLSPLINCFGSVLCYQVL